MPQGEMLIGDAPGTGGAVLVGDAAVTGPTPRGADVTGPSRS